MADINDGGPAFPEFGRERTYANEADRFGHYEYVAVGGMSLRDYFAGQAMAGLLATPPLDADTNAVLAYAIADAMLKARATDHA